MKVIIEFVTTTDVFTAHFASEAKHVLEQVQSVVLSSQNASPACRLLRDRYGNHVGSVVVVNAQPEPPVISRGTTMRRP